MRVAVLIPALDEEGAIAHVVRGILASPLEAGVRIQAVVVVDNGSTDGTAEVARQAGAIVVSEPVRGYGRACLTGIAEVRRLEPAPDIVVFADGDGSNAAADLPALLTPIQGGEADLVIGSRTRWARPDSLTPPQRLGNLIAARLLNALHDVLTTDLGPFRAVRFSCLLALGMEDQDFGWTVEMQLKAAKRNLRVREVDVDNLRRIAGKSKIAGTLRGTVFAGHKIISTIVRHQ